MRYRDLALLSDLDHLAGAFCRHQAMVTAQGIDAILRTSQMELIARATRQIYAATDLDPAPEWEKP